MKLPTNINDTVYDNNLIISLRVAAAQDTKELKFPRR